jgi:tripartite-type tricarboxylate transporter receptor subunit TctC
VKKVQHAISGVLSVSSAKRTALLPDVPTIAESGVPEYVMHTWWGVLGPARLPHVIVGKLNAEVSGMVQRPESVQRLESEGAEPSPMSSAEFGRLLASEVDKWRRVAREAGIKSE